MNSPRRRSRALWWRPVDAPVSAPLRWRPGPLQRLRLQSAPSPRPRAAGWRWGCRRQGTAPPRRPGCACGSGARGPAPGGPVLVARSRRSRCPASLPPAQSRQHRRQRSPRQPASSQKRDRAQSRSNGQRAQHPLYQLQDHVHGAAAAGRASPRRSRVSPPWALLLRGLLVEAQRQQTNTLFKAAAQPLVQAVLAAAGVRHLGRVGAGHLAALGHDAAGEGAHA